MNTQKNRRFAVVLFIIGLLLGTCPLYAHVVVKPAEVGIAAWQTFVVSVPNEKEIPAIGLRLVIPTGLKYVSPTVKPGWKIELKKLGSGEDATVTEIIWTDGSIPGEQRDDFSFSAQVPAIATNLVWKAYQTYQGNEIVSWDTDPNDPAAHDMEAMEKTGKGPYSITKVVDDLGAKVQTITPETHTTGGNRTIIPLAISIVAIVVALIALFISIRRKK